MEEFIQSRFNYWIYVILMMIGLWGMIAKRNLIKKLIGMSIFQTAIILFYVTIGEKEGSTNPIYTAEHDPHGHHAEHEAHPEEATATLELSTREPPMLQNSNITQDRPSKAPPKKKQQISTCVQSFFFRFGRCFTHPDSPGMILDAFGKHVFRQKSAKNRDASQH